MYNIKDQEIDFILRDIEARGVTLADLQDNLLDHMCCIIEYEKPDEVSFHKFYESILPRFFKKELKEILAQHQLWLDSDHEQGRRATHP